VNGQFFATLNSASFFVDTVKFDLENAVEGGKPIRRDLRL
jgi:hypothetical protein